MFFFSKGDYADGYVQKADSEATAYVRALNGYVGSGSRLLFKST